MNSRAENAPEPMIPKWERITPKAAEALLNLNVENRTLRRGRVEQYASDMKLGRWTPNPQPIIIRDDGAIADGQHRLWAVVESGATVDFLIVRGMPKQGVLNLDTGLTRALTDNARIAGDLSISHWITAAAVMVHYGTRQVGRGLSNGERLEIIARWEPHLRWAEARRARKTLVCNSVIGAAVARAHMHERDLERLARFNAILDGAMPEDGDVAAHTFRNYVMAGEDLARDSRDLFLKAQNAIRYFMRRRSLTVIKGVKEEAYPLATPNPTGRRALNA